jgi:hypothetical protein
MQVDLAEELRANLNLLQMEWPEELEDSGD